MKITDEIFQVGGGEFTSPEDAAIYLINFKGHAALVDAGCGRSWDRLSKNIRTCGVNPEEIEYLLITHCHYDHTGGAKEVKDMTGCKAVAHELDAQFLEAGDDRVTAATWYGARLEPFLIEKKLSLPREYIQLGDSQIEAIHTPGHSPGSVVYVAESLKLLLSIEADILCEGHYGIYKGKTEVEDFIRSFINLPTS